MSKRYPGGLITKTPVTPTTSSAPGVWTLEQALQYIKAGTWPLYVLSDPYFNYVTMLLHGDGTNGAQNNTFLDSSTNNFTITRNGNATQGSFSPYGNNWSNYLTGSSYLTWSGTSIGTNAFTFECWFYYTGTSFPPAGQDGASFIGPSSASSSALNLNIFNSTTVAFDRYGVSNDNFTVPTLVANTWYHIAFVRNASNVTTVFLNGTRSSTGTVTSSYNYSGTTNAVGYTGGAVSRYFPGYISNARLVIGSAVYDPTQTTITVPTAPLTAISGTSLLTCQSNRFIDNSTNAFTVSLTGTPSIQRFSPFSPTAAYSTSVIGGSGYFDGSGDYLTAPSNAAFSFGTGDFTVEGWVYPNAVTGGNAKVIVDLRGGSYLNSQVAVAIYNGGWLINIGGTQVISGGVAVINQWSHFALVRSGTNLKLFINGVQTGSTYSDSNNYSSYGEYIGNLAGGLAGYETVGYISDIRIVKGTAVYTSAFTPPTAPLTAIANTSLLTNFTNGGIFDNAMMNNLETVGSAQISTSVFKYGTGSINFGANNYLSFVGSPLQALGTGDFTVEWWMYPTSISTSLQSLFCFRYGNVNNFEVRMDNPGQLQLHFGGNLVFNASTNISSNNTWNHVALVRSNGTITMYLNGTSVGSTSTTYNANAVGTPCSIGGFGGGGNWWYYGNIDDFRITKGYARYTTTFTPPTAAFPNQ